MSSLATRPQHCRRRSQSASPSLSNSRRLEDDKWRKAPRRARPNALHSPTTKSSKFDRPDKVDVDYWRKGKRVRKGTSSPKNAAASVFSFASSIHDPDSFNRISTTLPCTAAAFQLYPNHSRRSTRSPRHTPRYSEPFAHVDLDLPSVEDVDRLRTDAFWDLRRSVEESGEGLVSRMREWEFSRSQPFAQSVDSSQPSRGRKRFASPADSQMVDSQMADGDGMEDEDDDILIVSHDDAEPPHKKRALSMSVMEPTFFPEHASSIASVHSARCPSPLNIIQDDERSHTSQQCSSPITPALTHASANSSLVSLPLSAPGAKSSPSSHYRISTGSVPASRSEKAIAALTLAMANGAGGLNDYADVLHIEGRQNSAIDESLVGDMWD